MHDKRLEMYARAMCVADSQNPDEILYHKSSGPLLMWEDYHYIRQAEAAIKLADEEILAAAHDSKFFNSIMNKYTMDNDHA